MIAKRGFEPILRFAMPEMAKIRLHSYYHPRERL
jgi:hypothetical protein